MIINTRDQSIRQWEEHKDKVRLHMANQEAKPSKSFERVKELIDEIYDGDTCKYPALFADFIKTCIATGDFKRGEIEKALGMACKCEKVKAILEGVNNVLKHDGFVPEDKGYALELIGEKTPNPTSN